MPELLLQVVVVLSGNCTQEKMGTLLYSLNFHDVLIKRDKDVNFYCYMLH